MGELNFVESCGVLGLIMTYAFKSNVYFIGKTRSETYLNTLNRESQPKNVQYLKNNSKKQPCFVLESCGA